VPQGDQTVCVIGGGVVGVSVSLALARRCVDVTLLEAERELCMGASGTNSGILHTGFDSPPGALETRLILRSAKLRSEMIERLRIPLLRTGARLRPRDERERSAVVELAAGAHANGVEVQWQGGDSLVVPGECVTDPVFYTLTLAQAAIRAGARIVVDARVDAIRADGRELELSAEDKPAIARCRLAVNCAGLFADEVGRAAGDDYFRIVPRKGEFFVFEPPPGVELKQIRLPVPSSGTKGVLVFPTTDGKIVAGPTAQDQEDKLDWTVRPEARREVLEKATALLPELESLEPIASYAGLRPAGVGVNYLIERSRACPTLLHVAAIRSTGLSASLGIAELVMEELAGMGLKLAREQPLEPAEVQQPPEPWWRRSARYWAARAAA
jgi:glycerol-3-phosphate dehydrogenase